MNHKSPHTLYRPGTTLIEVLAGLVILGTLLVSVAIARGRFLRQWGEAQQRIIASRQIDTLLSQWLAMSPQDVPIHNQGLFDDATQHTWQTNVIPSPAAATLGTIVVRLQVCETSARPPVLAQVDFLLQNPATRIGK